MRRSELTTLVSEPAAPFRQADREQQVEANRILTNYKANFTDARRQANVYTAQILQGEKPANMPVKQATKVDLVIDLNPAKALGILGPAALVGRADEVIE